MKKNDQTNLPAVVGAKKRPGRPSKYSDELLEEICERMSSGEDLESICRDAHMPDSATVYDWGSGETKCVDHEKVSQYIARARERGYDTIASNTRKIARGISAESSGDVARDKLIIDTDLKLLAKWSKRYSDKTAVDVTGNITLKSLILESLQKPTEIDDDKD